MVEWSIAAMRACAGVRSIVVACPPGHVHELGGHDLGVVEGGATRSQSVANALEAVGTELVADPRRRPPVGHTRARRRRDRDPRRRSQRGGRHRRRPGHRHDQACRGASISRFVSAFSPSSGENAAIVEETVDRGQLWAAQTPQVFRVEALRAALMGDPQAVAEATDEAMLVEAAGGRMLIHPAPPENLKVTTPLDLRLAELLLAERSAQ